MVKFTGPDNLPAALGPKNEPTQIAKEVREYCLIVEGAYLSESEAAHALRDPFIDYAKIAQGMGIAAIGPITGTN